MKVTRVHNYGRSQHLESLQVVLETFIARRALILASEGL